MRPRDECSLTHSETYMTSRFSSLVSQQGAPAKWPVKGPMKGPTEGTVKWTVKVAAVAVGPVLTCFVF